ncbi:uncharacterized protein LAJ45_06907 [Morchella importuna]|uniref:Zn(2)-C6 fungal-type domain-containing protein n=1 Tax=Morchella conica CCBAS932 TaxID=1392247 RepID=A0A3N4KQM5_9PEZI|nr:uncharacterized protein LAJ45_06907 [Morchella importuna]KAH8148933.1 hypothetical protein LAJ45_06907 [Morchella importuna]RPB12776.1 hypothetical protein P167DRAFT_144136 [Morchella conica CCBAS932]
MQPKAPKVSTKTHRRSRTGCFTCRLRRKKCDEGKPLCKACKHLGLSCEYKRPVWWGNVDQRKRQKETIKMLIKRTKLSEKVNQASPMSADSPPELSRSLPTSDTLSDTLARRRSLSMESGYTLDQYDIEAEDGAYPEIHHGHPHHPHHPFPPFEVDIMTEKQTYINSYGMPMRRSSTSTASYTSSLRRDSTVMSSVGFPEAFQLEAGISHHVHTENGHPAAADYNFFDFNYGQTEAVQEQIPYIPVDEHDQHLLDHFINNVLPILYPVLDLNLDGAVRRDVILPALASNECYRSCCLSIAALHLKATQGLQGEWIDSEITRHRFNTISGLCKALEKDTDHLEILEATIGMILFQCSVGTPDDDLPDIPWHQHFQAITSLVGKLDLQRFLQPLTETVHPTPSVNMTLTAWIDILGATMRGRAPHFADTYREKHLGGGQSGLRELMGCDDHVMYLISEIACLEALKHDNMLTEMELCEHIKSLGHQMDLTEPQYEEPAYPIITPTGHIDHHQLIRTTTAAFRYAARIYLCSLVPGFDCTQPQVEDLLNKLTHCLEHIPAGPDGFDKSLVWVMLIGGSVAMEGSRFRRFFDSRCALMGEDARYGSFGRMVRLLETLWERREVACENITWREVMDSENWDFLLI